MAFFSIDKLSSDLKIGTAAGEGKDLFLYTAGDADHVGIQWDANGATEGMLIGGADDHGVDFKFFGETSGKYVHWDMSGDELVLASSAKLSFNDAGGEENILASADGHLEVNAGTTLDMTAPTVDINASTAVTIDTDTATFASSNANDPLVQIKNTTNDANGAILRFVKDKGAAGAANDVNGLIQFYGDDAAQEQVMFSEIKSQVKVHTDGQEGGRFTISVAEHDGTSTAGLVIEDGDANGELDVTIGAGTSSVTTSAGNLTVTGNTLTFGNGATIVNTSNSLLTVTEAEVLLPTTTKLSFHNAAGGENILASADGHLEVNAGTTLDMTAPTVDINASTEVTIDTDTATFASSNENDPLVQIKNTNTDANGAILRFVKDKGAAGAANDVNGLIQFYGDDAAQEQVMFSEIKSQVKVHTDGQEGGRFTISVAEHDGTSTAGLVIEDGDANGELDVTIGAGTSSVTTIAGSLTISSTSAITSVTYEGDAILVSDNGVVKHMTPSELAVEIEAVTTSSVNTFTATQIFQSFFVNTSDTVTYGDGGSGNITATTANGSSHDPTSSIVFLQAIASSTDTTYHWDLTSFTAGGASGTALHLIFDKEDDTNITGLQVNFGSNNLYSGNGKNASLTFTTSGQSASLIYVNSTWRIINTGATIS